MAVSCHWGIRMDSEYSVMDGELGMGQKGAGVMQRKSAEQINAWYWLWHHYFHHHLSSWVHLNLFFQRQALRLIK